MNSSSQALFCVVVKVRKWVSNINSFSDFSPTRKDELLIHTKMWMYPIKYHIRYKEGISHKEHHFKSHLYELSGAGKSIEPESRHAVTPGGEPREGREFSPPNMKLFKT